MTQPRRAPHSPSTWPDACRLIAAGLLLLFLASIAAQDEADRFRVRGILGKSAFVEDIESGQQVVVRVGDDVGPMEVERIGTTSVRFVRSDGTSIELTISTRGEGDVPARAAGGDGAAAEAPAADDSPRAELKVTATGNAYFEILPEGRKFKARQGDMLGNEWKLVEVRASSVLLQGAEGVIELSVGDEVAATGVFDESAGSAGGAAGGLAYIGQGGAKAMFELEGPSGRKQLTAARGEQVRPGLELVDFDSRSATVRDLASGAEQRIRRARSHQTADVSADINPESERVPAYPWRVPLWEREISHLLDRTTISLRLTDRDLDACVNVLRDRHGLPLALDPDVLEELSDELISTDMHASQTPAREVLEKLVEGKPLMVEPAFGVLMVGLPRNLRPIAEARRTRDEVLTTIRDLHEELESIPGAVQSRWEESLAEQLRFVRAEVPAELDTLSELVKFIELELGIPSSMPAADRGRKVSITAGRRSLEDLLLEGLEGADLVHRWSGNLLILLSPEAAASQDSERAALDEQRTALLADLLEFPRATPLGLSAAVSGPLWFVSRTVSDAAQVDIVVEEAAWEDLSISLRLPAGATLGDLLDSLAPYRGVQAVRASDRRLVVLSLQ